MMIAKPFTNIAISLSGGGYRATTFHLGALSYLNHIEFEDEKLLKRVKILSTISGGTLTGVMYAMYLAKGRIFEDCYDKLHELLKKDKLLEHAMEKLNSTTKWNDKEKTKDVINAFSEIYNEHFYENETFKVLLDDDDSHIQDAIFGSTEFTYGIQFRFQEDTDKGRFGNRYLNIPNSVAAEVRLGDVAASSSCFPGGFEPMVMPKDYSKGKDGAIEKIWKEKGYQTTGIMDGGIIDNQGIEGVKLAEKRRRNNTGEPFIGTYIISDVSGKTMEPYEVPILKRSSFKDFFTFQSLNIIIGLIAAFLVGTLVLCPFEADWLVISSSVVLTLCAIWFVLFYIGKSQFLKVLHKTIGKSNAPHLFKDFGIFLKTPIYVLAYLIEFRLTSVMKMVSDVFMRRIRALQIKALFTEEKWNYRVKANNIYTLKGKPDLGEVMNEVVETANSMPTTLWFSTKEIQNNTLDKLIACGQFTLCRNLIRYIERIQSGSYRKKVWETLSENEKAAILDLDVRLKADFELFKKDPLRLVRKKNA